MLKIRQPHIILGQVNKYAPKEQIICVVQTAALLDVLYYSNTVFIYIFSYYT